MKLDDTHPDYFVNDSDPNTDAADKKTIQFTDADTASDSNSAGDRPAEPAKPRHSRWRRFLAWLIAAVVVILGVAIWLRYYNPYVSDARMKCYVISVEKRGLVFKTYEADVVSENALTDTVRLYSRDMSFSIDDDALARRLQQMQGSGRPVEITYRTYNATLPWRGASKSVITDAQTE